MTSNKSSSVAHLKHLGLDRSTSTDPVALLRQWSSRSASHLVIENKRGGVNRCLLPPEVLSERRAVASACDLSRETSRRIILVVALCYVLIEDGTVTGIINLSEGTT